MGGSKVSEHDARNFKIVSWDMPISAGNIRSIPVRKYKKNSVVTTAPLAGLISSRLTTAHKHSREHHLLRCSLNITSHPLN